MSTRARRFGQSGFLLLFLLVTTTVPAQVGAPPRSAQGSETLVRPDGQRIVGKLQADPAGGFSLVPAASGPPVRVESGSQVIFDGPEPEPTAGFPPFRIELGLGQRISGRLGAVEPQRVRLAESSLGGPFSIARAGVAAVIQRPGEVLVLQDGFEVIDASRWTVLGTPELADEPRIAGEHSLRIPAGGTTLTCRLAEPVGSGRLDLAFHDSGVVAEGQQWFVDLSFRSHTGTETVRAVLGWSEESLSVESPGGPALAVQRLAHKPGWHRLGLRFGSAQTEIGVDSNDLAHGKGPDGPLVEIRLASSSAGKPGSPAKLAGIFDDLRLVRFTEPLGDPEIDPNQDEVRLAGGDQLFGSVTAADGDRIGLKVEDRQVTLPWTEVSGLYLRRVAVQSPPLDGLFVRLEWHAAPGGDPSDLDAIEGALLAVSDQALTLATPYAGTITLPRDRKRWMRVQSSGRRILIDGTAHHLGDQVSVTPPALDPPLPEGPVLERTVELAEVPARPAALVLDVVQVVGVASGLPFAMLVQKGELRTNVTINGHPVDYLNRHITTKNETPERIRLLIPPGLLRPGRNLIRFQQLGVENDPNFLDDLGVLGIALEFESERSSRPRAEQP